MRQLTREALEELYRNPIPVPMVPDYAAAETIIDVRHRAAMTPSVPEPLDQEDIVEAWLRAHPEPELAFTTAPMPMSWGRRLSLWLSALLG